MTMSFTKISLITASAFMLLTLQSPRAGIWEADVRVRNTPPPTGEEEEEEIPPSLKTIPVPAPSDEVLAQFVRNKKVAIQLGKALFWDTQVGSDSKVACATCHFQAGIDGRTRNQLNPGVPSGDSTFQVGSINSVLSKKDFPYTRFASPNSDRLDPKVFDSNDITGSQGVFNRSFVSSADGQPDVCDNVADPIFHGVDANGKNVNTRRLEDRNTPTVINAVFNHRNFWDSRANSVFNGVDPFGKRNKNAFVWKLDNGELKQVVVAIESSSLASQASGPPVSALEMSCKDRRFHDVAKKLLSQKILAHQDISKTDSVLRDLVDNRPSYEDLIKEAFQPEWWEGGMVAKIARPGSMDLRDRPIFRTDVANDVSQMESNFALFFGLAIQMYESTLVSDDSPFDRFAEGNPKALTAEQKHGLQLFMDEEKGRCLECHAGAEFTGASHTSVLEERLDDMVIGGERSIYDTGFNNVAMRPTTEDIGTGGIDPFGFPFSETRLVQLGLFNLLGAGFDPANEVPREEILRTSVDGSLKVPSLRNVELTGPYFHNGGTSTLMQVVDFYSRGGNFFKENEHDMDEDVRPIGLTEKEKHAIVAFLLSLTDERVRLKQAPFDHPSLCFPSGHKQNGRVLVSNNGNAEDIEECIKAVGAEGVERGDRVRPFLNLDPFKR